MSEAKIRIGGRITGTAWLVHPRHAITAAHCVGALGTAVELLFVNPISHAYDVPIAATVLVRDALQDGALLQLATAPPGIPVLSIIQSPVDTRPQWLARGFPAIAENNVHLFEARGTVGVTTALVQDGNPQVIQLNLANASSAPELRVDEITGNAVHSLAGLSGSAVRILDDLGAGHVIGIIRCSVTAMPQDIIYAAPIEALWDEFAPHLPGVTLHRQSRTNGTVRTGPVVGSVISNIDEDLVAAAWKDNVVKDITVDLPWDATSPLIPAILRIILHQPGIERLRVRNPAAWNARLHNYADTWIALERFNLQGIGNPAIECAQPSTESGNSFSSGSAVAEVIHSACDRFVLEHVDQRLGLLFELTQPRDIAGYDIARDVLQQMKVTWAAWRSPLRADAALLHHFLALMLTHEGGHDCTLDPSPGAGPLTMEECILPAIIFGLAIAPILPTTLAPKHPQPGNVGQNGTSGHACGILAIKRRRMEFELRGRQWQTQVVLLQGLRCTAEVLQASTSTLLSGNHSQRPTLNRPAPSALVISRDEETEAAIGAGARQLRHHLASLTVKHVQIQAAYETSATPST